MLTYKLKQRGPQVQTILDNSESSTITYLVDHDLHKICEYLHGIRYDSHSYKAAIDYFTKYRPKRSFGMCSSVKKNNLLLRSFDWNYDETNEFVIRCCETRENEESISYESIGIGQAAGLTRTVVESRKYNHLYEILPYFTVDGINSCGVTCNINVVPIKDKTSDTDNLPHPTYYVGSETGTELCTLMIPRFVLDNSGSALEAVQLLSLCRIWSPNWETIPEEYHFMISDLTSCYVVEFVYDDFEEKTVMRVFSDQEDEFENFPNGLSIMTNFYLDGWDGNIITGFDTDEGIRPQDTTLTPHSSGIERYKILQDLYNSIEDVETSKNALSNVEYTKMYDLEMSPFWYSEYVGQYETFGDLTILNSKHSFEGIVEYCQEMYKNRQRGDSSWQTVHSVIYDIKSRCMYIRNQEFGSYRKFEL